MATVTVTVTPKGLPTPLPNFLFGNWRTQVTMDTQFITDITDADTLAEARRGLLIRPRRTIRFTLTGMSRQQSAGIQQDLLRHANDIVPVPIFQDQAILTGPTESATDKIPVDTTHGRWFVGARIVILKGDVNAAISAVQYLTIATLDPAFIEVNEPLGDGEYVAGDFVIPTIDAQISVESQRIKVHTDFHGEVKFKAVEVTGVSALPRLSTTVPTEFFLFPSGSGGDDRPIFDIPINYAQSVSESINRDGAKFSSGRGVIVFTRGARARFSFDFSILSQPDEAFQFLKFFDWAQGQLQQFWFPDHLSTLEPATANPPSSGFITVKQNGRLENLQDFLDFVFIDQDLAFLGIGIVTTVGIDGSNWKINFSNIAQVSVIDPYVRLASAHKVRFSNDKITEKWTTDELMSIQLRFKEVLQEKAVAVPNL